MRERCRPGSLVAARFSIKYRLSRTLFAERKVSKRLVGVRLLRRLLGGPELWLCLGNGSNVANPSIFGLDNSVDGVKFGFQSLKSTVVFPRELLDEPIELTLRSIDLLLEQIGTVL
jgi:hypothetical protein